MGTIYRQDLGGTAQTSVYDPIPRRYAVKTENNDYTILIVDDNPAIRELVSLYLKILGYNVLLAENGAKALQLVAMQPVNLIFLDIMLPDMDGLAA